MEIIIVYCRQPLHIFAGDYLLLKSTTKSHLTLLSVESKGRGNKAMIIPLDFTVSVSGQQQLLLSDQLPDTFSPCKKCSFGHLARIHRASTTMLLERHLEGCLPDINFLSTMKPLCCRMRIAFGYFEPFRLNFRLFRCSWDSLAEALD